MTRSLKWDAVTVSKTLMTHTVPIQVTTRMTYNWWSLFQPRGRDRTEPYGPYSDRNTKSLIKEDFVDKNSWGAQYSGQGCTTNSGQNFMSRRVKQDMGRQQHARKKRKQDAMDGIFRKVVPQRVKQPTRKKVQGMAVPDISPLQLPETPPSEGRKRRSGSITPLRLSFKEGKKKKKKCKSIKCKKTQVKVASYCRKKPVRSKPAQSAPAKSKSDKDRFWGRFEK